MISTPPFTNIHQKLFDRNPYDERTVTDVFHAFTPPTMTMKGIHEMTFIQKDVISGFAATARCVETLAFRP
jgi:hypothetical protein